MPWPKPSAEKTGHLERALSGRGNRRLIFGAPTWFMGGNMFAGVFGDDVFLRLTTADLAEIKNQGAKPFAPMKGDVIKEYALLPPAILGDNQLLAQWIGKSISYASSLPAKAKKK
jgi:TfoX/Sxy family transcriptional regulator of competence genes